MKEELRNIAGISTNRMLEADPLESIIKDVRKKIEKDIKRVCKAGDCNYLNHLRMYRLLTKFLNRESLSIFDMPNFKEK